MPVSAMLIFILASSFFPVIVIVPPSGVNFIALFIRLIHICCSSSLFPLNFMERSSSISISIFFSSRLLLRRIRHCLICSARSKSSFSTTICMASIFDKRSVFWDKCKRRLDSSWIILRYSILSFVSMPSPVSIRMSANPLMAVMGVLNSCANSLEKDSISSFVFFSSIVMSLNCL